MELLTKRELTEKRIKYSYGLWFILFLLLACSKIYTKEDYLSDYEHFVLRVKQNWEEYSEKDWEVLEEKNNKFFVTDYNKFSSEFKPSEVIRVYRFNFIFKFYKGDINITSLLSGEYNNVFKGAANELIRIIKEFELGLNDLKSERTMTIINKLME